MKLDVIDLFCGVGGFSLGAEKAGFSTKLSVDIDPDLTSAWSKNFPQSKLMLRDVSDLSCSEVYQSTKGRRPVAVIGGPPCQGFSRIGQRKRDDPRNTLIGIFFKKIKEINPKFFVMENVEGLLDPENRELLGDAINQISDKYHVLQPLIVNAADAGAPTNRRRVIIIGTDPSEVDSIDPEDLLFNMRATEVTVRDAISDLPKPTNLHKEYDYIWGRYKEDFTCSKYALSMRKRPKRNLGWESAIKAMAAGLVSGNNFTRHGEEVIGRFSNTLPGQVEVISRYPRLSLTGKCPTLRAGTGKSNGSYQAMRPIHPEDARVITIREAARLQGFPDWFVFHPTIWHSFRMIGNSVSPILSEAIFRYMKTKI